MLATFEFFIFEKLGQKMKLKIHAEDHFLFFSARKLVRPPTQPPGNNGNRSRQAPWG